MNELPGQMGLIEVEPIGWTELTTLYNEVENAREQLAEAQAQAKAAKAEFERASSALAEAGRRVRASRDAEARDIRGRALANRKTNPETGEIE